ncbi:hypothetical protein L198_01196 [Cryptococcus wingfieldii CBS 7118]|uniref:Uncharacterized protein n=1 Tax=Cryptococcus wingfieldii CBS 7118 TaxID=1295528 RepID=A0A1E3K3I1_9TREE|nr:hypothetical protein L198_01196 [Cryptococcus wingfieldii CBS 7118]ODO07615.1 hypothetical protein L198_01196 [Cryptococcus wingfieldii CBS 7118]
MPPPSLLLFTTSQTPLPLRYPHPQKPTLALPPLLHRSLHTALDRDDPSLRWQDGAICILDPQSLGRSEPLPVENGHAAPESVHDEREVTVKVHLVAAGPEDGPGSASTRAGYVPEALALLQTTKGLGLPDNLLVGFKGIDYKGTKTGTKDVAGPEKPSSPSLPLPAAPSTTVIPPELEAQVLAVWSHLFTSKSSLLQPGGKLGSMYAPLNLLKKLVERGEGGEGEGEGVEANVLDTPDCHHLPGEYAGYAREKGVQLWAGGGREGSDPIPSPHLQNSLHEFLPLLRSSPLLPIEARQLLSNKKLDKQVAVTEDGLGFVESGEGGVEVRWALSYTVISKTRNVVEDKGYIIAADFLP